jgi:hypothetical protein
VALGVLLVVHPLQKVRGDEMFPADGFIGYGGPVEVVVLPFLLDGADLRAAEGR